MFGRKEDVERRLSVEATTVGAVPATVDTGFACEPGHAASLVFQTSTFDEANFVCGGVSGLTDVRRAATGLMVVAGQFFSNDGVSDAALGACAMAVGVSAGGTLLLTFTPPPAYTGTIRWMVSPDAIALN